MTSSARDLANASKVSETLAYLAEQSEDLEELVELLANWTEKDPDGAIAWLASGERGDDVLRVMFALWADRNPDAATAWLAANQKMEGYNAAAVGASRALAKNDPEAALSLAETVTDPLAQAQIWSAAGGELYYADQDELRQRLADTDIPVDLQTEMIDWWKVTYNNKAKRNAQNLASVYSAALAAGANFEGNTRAEIVAELVTGVYGSESFATTRFQVPNMNPTEIDHALPNLKLGDNGQMNYNSAE